MYVLVVLADVVEIKPHDFNKASERAIEDWINQKYADRVLHQIGLCVGFHSLIKASEGLIGHGDGLVSVNVDFRLVVFRPFKGEIIMGTITSSDEEAGIFLSTEFFDDIQVPPTALPDNTTFDKEQEVFIWRYKDPDNTPEDPKPDIEYFFDRAEKCLMRIETEHFNDIAPQQDGELADPDVEQSRAVHLKMAPYSVQANMADGGTGPKMWWIEGGELAADGDAMQD